MLRGHVLCGEVFATLLVCCPHLLHIDVGLDAWRGLWSFADLDGALLVVRIGQELALAQLTQDGNRV